jgi:CDP-2,3-bis-(O-geranylgeranyl)-sn-glycerol synthase
VRVIQVLYLFAPLLLSAALSGAVMRFNWWSGLYRPLDCGRSFRAKRVFGDSKTWRGVIVALVGCSIGTALQKYALLDAARAIALVDYARVDVLAFASAMGLGAMLGELPNSFTKRQLGIAPGKTTRGVWGVVFYVWDQVDLLSLSIPLLTPWVAWTWQLVATSVLVALLVHPLTSLIGYMVGARRSAR